MHKLVPRLLRSDGVVPFFADAVMFDVEGFEPGVGDFDFGGVVAGVEFGGDLQAGASGGAAEEGQEGVQRSQRHSGPVLRDEAEETVFDPVPFGATRWVMADGDRQAGLVGEALQFPLPESIARGVAATAVCEK